MGALVPSWQDGDRARDRRVIGGRTLAISDLMLEVHAHAFCVLLKVLVLFQPSYPIQSITSVKSGSTAILGRAARRPAHRQKRGDRAAVCSSREVARSGSIPRRAGGWGVFCLLRARTNEKLRTKS